VIVIAFAGLQVRVHESGRETRKRVKQLMLCCDGNLMSCYGGRVGADHDLAFGPELMAYPSQPDVAEVQNAGDRSQRLLRLINQGRIDGIHQPTIDLPSCLPQHDLATWQTVSDRRSS
jgi:hypothetical protein